MSEQELRFILLSELKTVRLRCKKPECGAVTELSLEAMEKQFRKTSCPVCAEPFEVMAGGDNVLEVFARAARMLARTKVDVEFVLPAPPEGKG